MSWEIELDTRELGSKHDELINALCKQNIDKLGLKDRMKIPKQLIEHIVEKNDHQKIASIILYINKILYERCKSEKITQRRLAKRGKNIFLKKRNNEDKHPNPQ